MFCFGRNEEKQCSLPKDVEDAQWSVVSAGMLHLKYELQSCCNNARVYRLEDDVRRNHGSHPQPNSRSLACLTRALQTAKWRVRCFGDDSSGIVSKAPTLPQTWTVLLLPRVHVCSRYMFTLFSRSLYQVNSISVGDQHACAIVVNSARQSAAAASASVIGNSTRKTLVGGNVTCWGDDKFGRLRSRIRRLVLTVTKPLSP